VLLISGALVFFFGLQIAEQVYPSYQVSQTISSLGVASASAASALIFNSSLVIEGIMVMVAAFLLQLSYHRIIISSSFFLGGLGAVAGAILPQDLGLIHLEISIFAFFVAGLTPFVSLLIQHKPFAYVSIVLGSLTFVAAVLLSLGITFGLPFGAMERVVAYPSLLWAIAFGGYLANERSTRKD
jgi:hypothetical membrane protein